MIDIHAHILPGIDDGSRDILDSVLMAELALESGVDTIIATPHSNIPWEDEENRLEHIIASYQSLKTELSEKKLPLNLLLGMEIYATEDMGEKIRRGELISLNNSNHYLLEFDFQEEGTWCTQRIQDILEIGGIPIIAHAERYECVQRRLSIVAEWIDMGCQIQVNKGSVFGKFGRSAARAAMELLDRDLVDYVASDAHSPYERTPFMEDIAAFLREEMSPKVARRLLQENAERYLLHSDGRISEP